MKNEAQCKYFEDYDRKVRCKIDRSIHNDCCSSCPHFKPNLRLRIYWLLHPGERRLLLYGDRYYGTRKRKNKYHSERDRMPFTELCERNVSAEYWTGRIE